MNETVIKRAALFALILGACLGILSLIPSIIGFGLMILMIFSGPIVVCYMKKNEKHLSFINNEQGAIMGGVIGFCATIGFFASFSPLVCIMRFMFKNYYTYMIPDMLTTALWLFFVLVFSLALIFAATNAASTMALAWVYSHFEKQPDEDNRLDIKIED